MTGSGSGSRSDNIDEGSQNEALPSWTLGADADSSRGQQGQGTHRPNSSRGQWGHRSPSRSWDQWGSGGSQSPWRQGASPWVTTTSAGSNTERVSGGIGSNSINISGSININSSVHANGTLLSSSYDAGPLLSGLHLFGLILGSTLALFVTYVLCKVWRAHFQCVRSCKRGDCDEHVREPLAREGVTWRQKGSALGHACCWACACQWCWVEKRRQEWDPFNTSNELQQTQSTSGNRSFLDRLADRLNGSAPSDVSHLNCSQLPQAALNTQQSSQLNHLNHSNDSRVGQTRQDAGDVKHFLPDHRAKKPGRPQPSARSSTDQGWNSSGSFVDRVISYLSRSQPANGSVQDRSEQRSTEKKRKDPHHGSSFLDSDQYSEDSSLMQSTVHPGSRSREVATQGRAVENKRQHVVHARADRVSRLNQTYQLPRLVTTPGESCGGEGESSSEENGPRVDNDENGSCVDSGKNDLCVDGDENGICVDNGPYVNSGKNGSYVDNDKRPNVDKNKNGTRVDSGLNVACGNNGPCTDSDGNSPIVEGNKPGAEVHSDKTDSHVDSGESELRVASDKSDPHADSDRNGPNTVSTRRHDSAGRRRGSGQSVDRGSVVYCLDLTSESDYSVDSEAISNRTYVCDPSSPAGTHTDPDLSLRTEDLHGSDQDTSQTDDLSLDNKPDPGQGNDNPSLADETTLTETSASESSVGTDSLSRFDTSCHSFKVGVQIHGQHVDDAPVSANVHGARGFRGAENTGRVNGENALARYADHNSVQRSGPCEDSGVVKDRGESVSDPSTDVSGQSGVASYLSSLDRIREYDSSRTSDDYPSFETSHLSDYFSASSGQSSVATEGSTRCVSLQAQGTGRCLVKGGEESDTSAVQLLQANGCSAGPEAFERRHVTDSTWKMVTSCKDTQLTDMRTKSKTDGQSSMDKHLKHGKPFGIGSIQPSLRGIHAYPVSLNTTYILGVSSTEARTKNGHEHGDSLDDSETTDVSTAGSFDSNMLDATDQTAAELSAFSETRPDCEGQSDSSQNLSAQNSDPCLERQSVPNNLFSSAPNIHRIPKASGGRGVHKGRPGKGSEDRRSLPLTRVVPSWRQRTDRPSSGSKTLRSALSDSLETTVASHGTIASGQRATTDTLRTTITTTRTTSQVPEVTIIHVHHDTVPVRNAVGRQHSGLPLHDAINRPLPDPPLHGVINRPMPDPPLRDVTNTPLLDPPLRDFINSPLPDPPLRDVTNRPLPGLARRDVINRPLPDPQTMSEHTLAGSPNDDDDSYSDEYSGDDTITNLDLSSHSEDGSEADGNYSNSLGPSSSC